MRWLIVWLCAVALLAPAQGKKTFSGVITDSMCATGDHSRMRMCPTDADFTVACVLAHGALYVLYDGKEVYELSDQKTPEKLAGKKVTVTGTLNASVKKIQVESIAESK